jgi:methyl-accepting chemotaxis protein
MNSLSIKLKIILLVSCIGLVLSGLLAFIAPYQADELGSNILRKDAEFVAILLAENLALGMQTLMVDDGSALENTLGRLVKDKDDPEAIIKSVRVFDENMGFVKGLHSSVSTITSYRPQAELSFEEDDERIRVWSPMFGFEQETLGYVEIDFSKRYLINRTAENVQLIWLISLAAIFVTVILGFILAKKISQPVLDITQVVHKVAQGDLSQQQLVVKSNDEVGVLAQNLNQMLIVLQQLAQHAISIARDDLENAAHLEIKGELGEAFRQMNERMKWLAGQMAYISAGDLYNEDLMAEGEGTMGSAVALMVRNLRQTEQDLKTQTEHLETQTEHLKSQSEQTLRRQEHVMGVAQQVLEASNNVATAADKLSASARSLKGGSEHQKQSVEETAASIQQMAASSQGVAGNTDELARLVADNSAALTTLASSIVSVTQNSEQMSQSVTSNASAIEEMAASIQAQAEHADQANQTVQEASRVAQEGTEIVHQTIEAMDRISKRVRSSATTIGELGKSSEQVSTIVAVINDIADQTNLLALNAAIEAARAGEQGRGFAVVADEVRKLAERTSQATQKIYDMIGRMQSDTQEVVVSMEESTHEIDEGTALAARSGEALNQMGEGVQQVYELVGQLNAASREQALTSNEIVEATSEMNGLVQQVTMQMGEQAQAVEVVSQGSEEMQQRVDQVTNAMREQTQTASAVVQSVEETNQVVQQSLDATHKMSESTDDLARQAENLKQLSQSFDNEQPDSEEARKNGDGFVKEIDPSIASHKLN